MDDQGFDRLARALAMGRSRRAVLKALAVAAGGLLAARGGGAGAAGKKVPICHRTGSATNPYVYILVSDNPNGPHSKHLEDVINVNLQTNPHHCGECGQSCDDGDPCTDDACVDGRCVHPPKDCSAQTNACHVGVCQAGTGTCVAEAQPDDTACGVGQNCCGGICCQAGQICFEGTCMTRTNSPPTAILEINGPCGMFGDGTLSCNADQPRSTWTWSRPGNGFVFWGCNNDRLCEGRPTDPTFRGTASTDPDGDIVSWSIDFGDGTSTGGSWTTDPPIALVHAYPPFPDVVNISPVVTLTVTDAAGQTASDAMQLVFFGPD